MSAPPVEPKAYVLGINDAIQAFEDEVDRVLMADSSDTAGVNAALETLTTTIRALAPEDNS